MTLPNRTKITLSLPDREPVVTESWREARQLVAEHEAKAGEPIGMLEASIRHVDTRDDLYWLGPNPHLYARFPHDPDGWNTVIREAIEAPGYRFAGTLGIRMHDGNGWGPRKYLHPAAPHHDLLPIMLTPRFLRGDADFGAGCPRREKRLGAYVLQYVAEKDNSACHFELRVREPDDAWHKSATLDCRREDGFFYWRSSVLEYVGNQRIETTTGVGRLREALCPTTFCGADTPQPNIWTVDSDIWVHARTYELRRGADSPKDLYAIGEAMRATGFLRWEL